MFKQWEQKFVLVCGGVASGIGKGIAMSSLAYLIKMTDTPINLIKIDPYLNIDAGTMSPYEHGECYVLEDGGEVDLDLGNYERFVGMNFCRDNNITTGKIYDRVLRKERKGEYLGKTVQVIPHVAYEVVHWILTVADRKVLFNGKWVLPQIVLVELGGTVGDMESVLFFEAFRELILRNGKENVICILTTYVPYFNATGENKTKPTQKCIKDLMSTGNIPDFLFVRSEGPLSENDMQKIAMYGSLPRPFVINIPNLKNQFEVPILLEEHNICGLIMQVNAFFLTFQKLELPIKKPQLKSIEKYNYFICNELSNRRVLKITLVGKYPQHNDAYLSVTKALQSACISAGLKLQLDFVESEHLVSPIDDSQKLKASCETAWDKLKAQDGLLIPGGFGERGFHGKALAAEYARLNNIPIFGICFGFQAMVVEYAKNVLGIQKPTSEEFFQEFPKEDREKIIKEGGHSLVISYIPNENEDFGGTMRLGGKSSQIKSKDTLAYQIYGKKEIFERHRHRYEVNPSMIEILESKDLKFSAVDNESKKRMEILEIKNHKFYFGVQFHPEYNSQHFKPHPIYLAFILASAGKLEESFLKEGGLREDFEWKSLKLN